MGYAFVALVLVAVITALQMENNVINWLLFMYAVVSMVLVVMRFIYSKKVNVRIKYFEEHHLLVSLDEES